MEPTHIELDPAGPLPTLFERVLVSEPELQEASRVALKPDDRGSVEGDSITVSCIVSDELLSLAARRGLAADEMLRDAIAGLSELDDAFWIGERVFAEAQDGTLIELVAR